MKKQLHSRNLLELFYQSGFLLLVFLFISATTRAQTGSSLNFNEDGGNDDYIVTPGTLITTGSYTKEAWILLPTVDALTHNIMSENNGASGFYILAGQLAAGQNTSYPPKVTDPAVLQPNVWYHVAVTYDDATNTMTLFKNGSIVATALVNKIVANGHLAIGATYSGNYTGYNFVGNMDEVRIWSYARAPQEIADNMHCTMPVNTPGLIAYYDFNQGTANGNNTAITKLIDRSGNGNDADIFNFAMTGAISNFTDATPSLTGECSVVAVQLSGFTAKTGGNTVKLNWQTATEINNAGFDIERSPNGNSDWQKIGFAAGAGNSVSINNYSFTDRSPLNGNNYYRLNQKDLDGNSSYSQVVSVRSAASANITLYPTMATSRINLVVTDQSLLNTPFIIYDNTGKSVQKGIIKSISQPVDISNLNNGVYFLKIQSATRTLKFIKQ